MTAIQLSRLQKVELRNVWETEAGSFTPWLAREENLSLLGDTIGLELELEAQERNVGPFRADILCKDTADSSWVLIENQLERTDHTHLGQLMTYAAGLKAVTIVWIADRFIDEHRAALDWLNDITDDRFNFFGLEVELWRIENSAIAPKFNVICKPNNWARAVSGGTRGPGPIELSEMQSLRREYWHELNLELEKTNSAVKTRKPQPAHWMTYAIGRAGFTLTAAMSTTQHWICVSLWCEGENAKPHFHLLRAEKHLIEKELGTELGWEELPDKKTSYINVYRRNVDPSIRENWPEQHRWLADMLDKYHQVFGARIKNLDANDHIETQPAPDQLAID